MKSVLITGISGGIGSAISDYFSELGYYVYGIDKNVKYPTSCNKFFQVDLDNLVKSSEYRLKTLDDISSIENLNCLINNAAVQILSSSLLVDLQDWQTTLNVNLTSPLILSQALAEALVKNQGSIINIGSIHAALTKRKFVSYATSKSALIGLTQSMAVDLNGKVRVNSISPAAVETSMLLEGFNFENDKVNKLRDIHPSGDIGRPIDIAKLAFFIADSNIAFLNGADIKIDGGISKVLKDL